MNEASYEGNMGMHELMLFHDRATPRQRNKLYSLLNKNKTEEALKLIEKVVGYELEKQKKLKAFDFDNTLAVSTARVIVKNKNSGKTTYLTPFEYVHYEKKNGDKYDFHEFDEVNNALPVKKYMEKFREAVHDPNTDVAILTARGSRAMKALVKFMTSQGLKKGFRIKTLASGSPEAKKNWIRTKIKKKGYSDIEFFDDHAKNTAEVQELEKEFPGIKINTETVPEDEYKPLFRKSAQASAKNTKKVVPPKKKKPSKLTPPEEEPARHYNPQGRIAMNLDRRIRNPETGNDILVRTALKYPKDTQVYQLAMRTLGR